MNNSDLLNSLADKLQNANKTVVLQKKRERQQIQQRLQNIDIIYTAKKKFQLDTLQKSKYSVQKIANLSNQAVKNMNLKTRKEQQLLRHLKQQIQSDLQNCQNDHQEKTQQIIQKNTVKMTEIIEQLTKKSKIISQSNQKSLFQLSRSLSLLEKDIQDESQQRKNNCKQIEQDISLQINKFNLMIQKQRQHRSLSQQKIQNMIKQISMRINTETQNSKNKRKKNNAALLKLIQGACQKLQQKINVVI